ncbi:MAG: photosystem reaction center subunit H [Archaeoglobi archaeon]|jgi:sporulation protein YlmC with PRC-barrel domain|nr:MAG: photosystem reaction center subunit H [Archaeoglobi archaeon]TDA28482.1 MAG: photosystem reaction center subunit H [Archaeoglobi archaeon]
MAMTGEITTLFGMKVFTDEGRYVGKIEDVIVDTNASAISGIVVVEYNKALIDSHARGVVIPYRLVKAVGDIVIIRDVFQKRFQSVAELRELTVEEEKK